MSDAEVTMEFTTPAPADAPETKGYTCYFRPVSLLWRVTPGRVTVTAFGPASRVDHRRGDMHYYVEGGWKGDERPSWLLVPIDLLSIAALAVKRLHTAAEVAR